MMCNHSASYVLKETKLFTMVNNFTHIDREIVCSVCGKTIVKTKSFTRIEALILKLKEKNEQAEHTWTLSDGDIRSFHDVVGSHVFGINFEEDKVIYTKLILCWRDRQLL